MQIQTGLFDHMVFQRTARNVSDAAISGKCSVAGTVEARVTQSGRAVKGFNWRVIGQAARRRFTGQLKGLGVGGPYDIELKIRGQDRAAAEALTVRDVLVGDVWVAAGQSNMFGSGRRHHAL
jgi:sialate O-acetylesterase